MCGDFHGVGVVDGGEIGVSPDVASFGGTFPADVSEVKGHDVGAVGAVEQGYGLAAVGERAGPELEFAVCPDAVGSFD